MTTDNFPNYSELENAYQNGMATMPVDRINHREFITNGTRYLCGWSSQVLNKESLRHVSRYNEVTRESYMEIDEPYSVVGWIVYAATTE